MGAYIPGMPIFMGRFNTRKTRRVDFDRKSSIDTKFLSIYQFLIYWMNHEDTLGHPFCFPLVHRAA